MKKKTPVGDYLFVRRPLQHYANDAPNFNSNEFNRGVLRENLEGSSNICRGISSRYKPFSLCERRKFVRRLWRKMPNL